MINLKTDLHYLQIYLANMVVYQQRPHPRVVLRHPWVVAGVTEGVLVVELGAMDPWEYNKVHRWAPIWTQDLYNPHLEDCSKSGLEIYKKKTLFLQTSSVYYWHEKTEIIFWLWREKYTTLMTSWKALKKKWTWLLIVSFFWYRWYPVI